MSVTAPEAPATAPGAPARDTGGLARLGVLIALVVVVSIVFHGLADLVVVLALIAMVMLHELGHFATAKWSGMKVTEYFLGFGPRLWSFRRGETEYGVKAIPAGGYVRIVGMTMLEEVDPADEARSYRQATFGRRLLVAVSGSATHFVLAFALLWAMVGLSGLPVPVPTGEVSAFTSFIGAGNPAEAAGFRPGDVLYSIDGERFSGGTGYVHVIESHAGANVTVVVRRAGHLVTLTVRPVDGRHLKVVGPNGTPVAAKPNGPRPVGVIGVELSFARYQTANPLISFQRAGTLLGSVIAATSTGIAEVFSLHGLSNFAHQVATAANAHSTSSSSAQSANNSQLISLPGAVEIGAQALQENVSDLLYILAAINIFVGMVNLFPMLPLDGGHVAIACYERLRTRRGRSYHADVTKLMPVAYLFLAFMVVIGLGALYANVVHPPVLPGG